MQQSPKDGTIAIYVFKDNGIVMISLHIKHFETLSYMVCENLTFTPFGIINFQHIFIKSFIIHSLELGESCTCNDFVDENGYGNCLKEINGKNICYVNQPSSCNDLEYSNSAPEKKISAEACSGNSVCKSYDQWQ